MKNPLMKSFLCLILTITGCAGPDQSSISLGSLEQLMEQNPELKKATLHQIKQAAREPKKLEKRALLSTIASDEVLASDSSENNEPPAPVALDQAVAENAQKLIDEVLDSFSLKDEFDSDMKLVAMVVAEQQEKLKAFMKDKGDAFEGKFAGFDTAGKGEFENSGDIFKMSCENIMAGNFAGHSLKKIGNFLEANKAQFRKTMSGCAKIQGEKFVGCMKDRIMTINNINENLTCSMKDPSTLDALLEEKTKMTKKELEKRATECHEIFKKCGYNPEAPNDIFSEVR